VLREKLERKEVKIESDDAEHRRESAELSEYEDHFKQKVAQLEKDHDEIQTTEEGLRSSLEQMDSGSQRKQAALERVSKLKGERAECEMQVMMQAASVEHLKEKLMAVDS
jgi:uncharacterized coiled-coil DUF342 family protein